MKATPAIGSRPYPHACHSQGRTPDEALENVQDAIRLCLKDASPRDVRIIDVDV